MKKKSFYKDLRRAVYGSKSRFFSIMAMIILGVSFFSGINATSPDMVLSADAYYKDYGLSDFRIMSPLGFSPEDLKKVREDEEISHVMESYSRDAFLTVSEERSVVRLFSYDLNEERVLDRPMVTEGRLPENRSEIVIEEGITLFSPVSLGDEVTLSLPEETDFSSVFHEDTYTVVGLIKSPLYISYERGQTNIGGGSVEYFAYIPEADFALDKVTDIFIRTEKSPDLTAYSDAYESYHEPVEDVLSAQGAKAMRRDTKELMDELLAGKKTLEEEKSDAEKALSDAEKEIIDARQALEEGEQSLKENEARYTAEFENGRREIADGREALEAGRKAYIEGYEAWLTGYKTWQEGYNELMAAKAALGAGRSEIIAGERELASARAQLEEGKEQIGMLEEGVTALKAIRASLPETPTLTEDEYLSLIAEIRLYLPEIADYMETNFSFEDPSLILNLGAALDSGIIELDKMLTDAKIQYAEGLKAYEAGIAAINAAKVEYESGLARYESGRLEIEAAKREIDGGEAELMAAKSVLEQSEAELNAGERELEAGEAEFLRSMEEGRAEIEKGWADLIEGERTFEREKADALKKLKEAEDEIRDAERMILEIPDEWFVYNRDGYPGYATLGDDAARLGSLATIFPLFFFLVAALVCLTTMTRMVEEERVQIGTLKALGYRTGTIAMKYIAYALAASLLGSVIGVMVGFQLFPRMIITVYGAMYSTPYILTPFHGDIALISTAIAVLTTVSATLYATLHELRETPANLMMPKAPKPGKRILLERITPLWKRMSFSYKVTFRNIFRYKKRFLMTVLGISGCSALLVTGFGIGDSVNAIMGRQFDEIFVYDGMVFLDGDEGAEGVMKVLEGRDEVDSYIPAQNETVTVKRDGSGREYQTSLLIPGKGADFRDFFDLHDRVTGEEISLTEEGAVLSEKLARLLGVGKGDTLTYMDADSRTYPFKVAEVAENYLAHYIYMSEGYFESITLRDPSPNAGIFTLKNPEDMDQAAFSESLMEGEGVLGSMLVEGIQDEFGKSLESLDFVVFVIVLAAGALAFVVLFNLTNINITERMREIATIKVLGFRDKEVSAYVYRENIFLTLIGTLLGLGLGFILHRFVINTMEIDNMMFGRIISLRSFIYSVLLTLGFAALVNIFMYRRLQHIDMAASLKSVE